MILLVRTVMVTYFGWGQKGDIVLRESLPVKIKLFQNIKFHNIKPAQNLTLSNWDFSEKLVLQLFWDCKLFWSILIRHSFFKLFCTSLSFHGFLELPWSLAKVFRFSVKFEFFPHRAPCHTRATRQVKWKTNRLDSRLKVWNSENCW